MKSIQASIYNTQGRRIKQYLIRSPDDLCFRHEMFAGVRVLDFSAQLSAMLEHQLTHSEENYSLHGTYEKFGAVQQEHESFTVKLRIKN